MSRLRSFNGYTDWDYVKTLTSAIACSDSCGVTVCDSFDGRLYGVVVFDQITPNSAQCHIAITHPIRALRAGLMKAAAEFIFNDLKRSLVYALVPANNKAALRFDKKVGFEEIMRLPDGFDRGVDYVLLEQHRDNCKWLNENENVEPCTQAIGGCHG